jgi:Rha family phage regulatory protein
MNELVFRDSNGVPMTNSLLVAETFGKAHRSVLRDIDNLECSENFQVHNFVQMFKIRELPNGGQTKDRYYNISKDGFTFLAMGYTGKKAAEFKEKYIAAFNAMERTIQQGAALSQQFMEMQMQMMSQMMNLCNTLMQRIDRIEPSQQPQSRPKKRVEANTTEPVLDLATSNKEYPWLGVVTTYRKLRLQYPKFLSVVQTAEELRRRGIGIRKTSLFCFLRESGLISGKDSTYHRPSVECVDKGWMVYMAGRSVERYPKRRYHTPYLSPEFVDILERKLASHSVKALELWKEAVE